MATEAEREQRLKAVRSRAEAAVPEPKPKLLGTSLSNTKAPTKGRAKTCKFPGTGQSLSGEVHEESDTANADNVETSGEEESDFGEDYDTDEDDDNDSEEYDDADDSDDSKIRTTRSGQGTYNLRTQGPKRKHAADNSASDLSDAGPSLRTRQRVARNYNESAATEGDSSEEE
ncbi:hypothetical protein H4R24_003088 [Coemansia sp. RSA 988]|nr:hypothetical protein H4R24_003088 [Coemansia sp. RSA 988]